jgi:hypothetical protein
LVTEPTKDESEAFHAFLDRFAAFVVAGRREHGPGINMSADHWIGALTPRAAELDSGHLQVAATLFDAYLRDARDAKMLANQAALVEASRLAGERIERREARIASEGDAERARPATGGFTVGIKVRVRGGWMQAGRTGRVVGRGIECGGQPWTPVVWSEGDSDPDWHKTIGLVEVA